MSSVVSVRLPTVGSSPPESPAHPWGMDDTRDPRLIKWSVCAPNQPPHLTSNASKALLVLMESARRRRRQRDRAARSDAA